MQRLVYVLLISFGALAVGYAVRRAVEPRVGREPLHRIAARLKLFTLGVLFPVPILNSFWRMSLPSGTLWVLPFLGVTAFALGGLLAYALILRFRVPGRLAGSVFVCSMFTNLGSFGSLVGFMFYGELGFLLVQMYSIFEMVVYYTVGFPLSDRIANGRPDSSFSLARFLEHPIALVAPSTIAVGLLLRASGLPAPMGLARLSAFLVPLVSAMLTFAIGITLRATRVAAHPREVSMVLAVKMVALPVVMVALGLLLGLHRTADAVPFKMLVFMSTMPVAFTAVIPPQLYDFDLDLANSAWFVSTVAMLVVLPLWYTVLEVMW